MVYMVKYKKIRGVNMKAVLLPADTYIVINKTLLSDKDRNLLLMLYQPLIGSMPISLYFTLWSYLDKLEIMSSEWTHHHLMSSLKVKLEEIMIAREKLEGIGLIKTYYKENNGIKNYIYELYSPMSAHEFLTNPILTTLLYNNIGKTEYEKTVKYFKKIRVDLSNYIDITSSFSEVFEITSKTNYEIISDEIKRSNKRNLEVISKIDLNDLFALIPEELLNYKKITKEVKEILHELSFIYNLDSQSLSEIILNSLNEEKGIDLNLLRENTRKFYQFENHGKLPSIIYKETPDYLKNNYDDSSESKQIYAFRTTSPYDFLMSKQNGGKPTKSELLLIEHLIVDLQLPPDVVNVLIDFVLRINNNKLTKSYVETIATQWKISKIETVEKAMEFARNEYNLRNQKKKKPIYHKKEEAKPAWFDEQIESDPISEEEKKELEAMLEEFK